MQASSYVFNGGTEPKLTDIVLISFGVIVCLFVSLLLRVVWGAAAFPSWGSDGRESPSRLAPVAFVRLVGHGSGRV